MPERVKLERRQLNVFLLGFFPENPSSLSNGLQVLLFYDSDGSLVDEPLQGVVGIYGA